MREERLQARARERSMGRALKTLGLWCLGDLGFLLRFYGTDYSSTLRRARDDGDGLRAFARQRRRVTPGR
jgi:hypothetical protein